MNRQLVVSFAGRAIKPQWFCNTLSYQTRFNYPKDKILTAAITRQNISAILSGQHSPPLTAHIALKQPKLIHLRRLLLFQWWRQLQVKQLKRL